jgi:hypothetical protein
MANINLATSRLLLAGSVLVGSTLCATEVRADGIDGYWFLTRAPASLGPAPRLILVVLILLVDYALNLLVIAVPASRFGVPLATSGREMVVFTLLAQAADRIGMGASILLVVCVRLLLPGTVTMGALGATVPYMLALNFVSSGALVWLLARHFLLARWAVDRRPALAIATAAAVFTNPAWAVAASRLFGFGR